jgi:hypothetical protein
MAANVENPTWVDRFANQFHRCLPTLCRRADWRQLKLFVVLLRSGMLPNETNRVRPRELLNGMGLWGKGTAVVIGNVLSAVMNSDKVKLAGERLPIRRIANDSSPSRSASKVASMWPSSRTPMGPAAGVS